MSLFVLAGSMRVCALSSGSYFDVFGIYLGHDAIDDGTVFIANEGLSEDVKKSLEIGDIITARLNSTEIPSLEVLEESIDVLSRTLNNGGYSEEVSVIVNDGRIIRGETGEPVNPGHTSAKSSIPSLPRGITNKDLKAIIHSHPTSSFVMNSTVFSLSALQIGLADSTIFKRFTNTTAIVVVGRLGFSTGEKNLYGAINIEQPGLGIVVYKPSGELKVQIPLRTAQFIVEKLKNEAD